MGIFVGGCFEFVMRSESVQRVASLLYTLYRFVHF